MASQFSINYGKGFAITFEHGTCVSVQFGGGNYCQNRNSGKCQEEPQRMFSCPNAEIAIFNNALSDRSWLTRQFNKSLRDDVEGYCSPEHVAKAIAWAARYDARLGQKKADNAQ